MTGALPIATTIFITAIPEPDTYLLMAVGAAALGFIARRRRSGTVAR